MAILVICPGCGSKLKAPDRLRGGRAKCSQCGGTVPIAAAPPPAPPSRPAPARPGPAPRPADSAPVRRRPPEPEPILEAELADEVQVVNAKPRREGPIEEVADEVRPRKKRRRKRKKPAPANRAPLPSWLGWVISFGVFLVIACIAAGVAIRQGHLGEVIAIGLGLVIMVPISTVILIISMFISSYLAGGIDFGEVHTAIPKAIALLIVVNTVSLIPFVGRFICIPIWIFGLMALFDLDFWESRFLVFINWVLNTLVQVFLLALILTAIQHRGEVAPPGHELPPGQEMPDQPGLDIEPLDGQGRAPGSNATHAHARLRMDDYTQQLCRNDSPAKGDQRCPILSPARLPDPFNSRTAAPSALAIGGARGNIA